MTRDSIIKGYLSLNEQPLRLGSNPISIRRGVDPYIYPILLDKQSVGHLNTSNNKVTLRKSEIASLGYSHEQYSQRPTGYEHTVHGFIRVVLTD